MLFRSCSSDLDDRALEPVPLFSEYGINEEEGSVWAHSQAGAVGVVDLHGGRKGKAVRTDANTNLMWPRAVMPTLMDEIEASEKDVWFVTAVFGFPAQGDQQGAPQGWNGEWQKRPVVPKEILELMK